MTADKLFAVTRPLKCHQSKFNKKRSVTFLCLAFVFCFLINAHFLYTHSIIHKNEILRNNKTRFSYACNNNKWNTFYNFYWPYIDATVYSFLPFILLCILNPLILAYIVKASKLRSTLMETHECVGGSTVSFSKNRNTIVSTLDTEKNKIDTHLSVFYSAVDRKNLIKKIEIDETSNRFSLKPKSINQDQLRNVNNMRFTLMMILVNVSFCIMTMPIMGLQIKQQFDYENEAKTFDLSFTLNNQNNTFQQDMKNFGRLDQLKAIAEILQYMNHGINFLLYCISGHTFRKETKIYLSECFNKVTKFLKLC